MSAKTFLVVCASALFVQSVVSQYLCSPAYSTISSANLVNVGGCGAGLSASGGGLSTSSASPIAPNGVSLLSQNSIDGCLDVSGKLPFLGAVALEGQVPSSGSAGVSYSCGNRNVGISSQSLSAAGYGSSNAAGLAGLSGINSGLAGAGYGSIGLTNAGIGNIGGLRLGGSSCGCGSIN